MATEDHDFEEANHFFLPDGKISWESGQGGAVGRMTPEGMEELAAELREKLGIGYHSGALLALFEKAYLKHNSIADATRFLVHKLFGHLGVIAVDGDDPALKSLAAPVFKQELLEGISSSEVEKTNESLSAHYDLQVHTRDINLFYLDNQLRERIVRREDGRFEVLHTRLQFSEAEMLDLLEKHPERFSPNVILRGLYQEIILPNLAYIGGGGELAYWFQLKGVFTAFKVPFPILMLRNSLMFVSRQANELMQSLELTDMDLFVPVLELENRLVNQHSEHVLNLDASHDKLEQVFLDIETKLREIDQTLERSVRSGYARTERIVKNLEKKMLRAERRKLDTLLGRLQKLRESLFPRDGLQERNMNFVVLYEAMGPEFIEKLLPLVDPFDAKFAVVKEMV
jgi:bacillithiol biosynthesis cysteine-adding enzyme BshC